MPLLLGKPRTLPGFLALVFILLVATGLSACAPGGVAFSAQQAAVQAASQDAAPGESVDVSTISVRQSRDLGESVFVLVSFSKNVENRLDSCLSLHEVRRTPIRTWSPSSGGTGCEGSMIGLPPENPPPLSSVSGQSGGSRPGDPGYSSAYGLVNENRIVKVRVTWKDGASHEADVVNDSYLAVRRGQVQVKVVEGLDQDGKTIYNISLDAGPGK